MWQNPLKPLQELENRLRNGEFGNTPESKISFCKQIAELDQRSSRQERMSLLKKVQVSSKKWDQLCRVGRDIRLSKYYKNLPSTLTAIYALTTLSKDELNDGMITGDLYRSISSRKIYAYAQECRLRSRAFSETQVILPCYLAIGKKGEELDSKGLEKLFKKVNGILLRRGVMILASVSSTSKFEQKQKELIAKEKKQGAIETEIEHQMYMASENLSNHFSLEEVDELMEGSMSQFALALLSISRSRLEMMEVYGRMYCYKIALEFYRSESRVQRYNYKRRLLHVQQKYKFLSDVVENIFSELVERPRTQNDAT